ncbi:MAG: murein biosynthesis integral membrane protein MurJ [Candidatus Brocadiia bacterium]
MAAQKFGVESGEIDAFMASMKLPRILGDFLVGGALYFALVPSLQAVRHSHGESAALGLALHAVKRIVVALALVSVFYFLFPASCIEFVAPGLTSHQAGLTVMLARLVSPLFVLMSLVLLATGFIQSYRHFAVLGVASIIPGLTQLLFLALFASDIGVASWASGMLVGVLLRFLVLGGIFALVIREHGVSPPPPDTKKRMWRLVMAIGGAVLLGRTNLIVQSRLASTVTGGLALVSYATALSGMMVSLAIGPFLIALYPLLTQQAAREKPESMDKNASLGIRTAIFVLIPIVLVVFLHRREIVRFLFERGQFGSEDTLVLSALLGVYACGAFLLVFQNVLTKVFYGAQDVKTILVLGAVHAVAAIILNGLLFRTWSLIGLAVANAGVVGVRVIVGLWVLKRRGRQLVPVKDIGTYSRLGLAAVGSSVLHRLIFIFLLPQRAIPLFFEICIGVLAVSIPYILACWALRIRELKLIIDRLTSYVRK